MRNSWYPLKNWLNRFLKSIYFRKLQLRPRRVTDPAQHRWQGFFVFKFDGTMLECWVMNNILKIFSERKNEDTMKKASWFMCIAFDLIACAKHSSSHYCQCFRRQSGRALRRELTKMAIPPPWLSPTTTSTFELGPTGSPLQLFLLLNSLSVWHSALNQLWNKPNLSLPFLWVQIKFQFIFGMGWSRVKKFHLH